MASELNRFLSPLDAGFLYVERPNETMHIGGCMVYEGEFSREHMIEQVGARMHLLPRYRQRVVFPPFLVSHPLWVDDQNFDIENHIDEVRLPPDSNEQVLGRVAAEAYSGMLDRDRPLWKGIVLRGIPGHTAVVWKIHHAMVDGVSGGDRGFAWAQFAFSTMRAVKSALGGTVNDVVLTMLAGGLGRYLRARGQNTAGLELRAMCPVSMRQAGERGQLGNLVSNMIAPLFVGVEDPVERLGRERDAMNKLKEAGQAKAFYQLSQFGIRVPPLMAAMGAALPFSQTLFNTVSTNVPGPMIPLYFGQHKLVDWLPLGIVSNNIGLFVSILTYNQRITLGITVDSKLIPDPWFLTQCLEASYAELRQAAGIEDDEATGARCFAALDQAEAAEPGAATPAPTAEPAALAEPADISMSDAPADPDGRLQGVA